MDPLTQAVLGGAIGQAVFHRPLGRRAFVAGALAGLLPDIDVIYQVDQWSAWRHHRGITHSLWFGPVLGPPLGWALWRYYRWRDRRAGRRDQADPDGRRQLSALIWVVLLGLFTHPLLDLMTPYGTQLLAPFSDHRFAFNAMAIIDPLYTLPLLIAGLLGLIWPERRRRAVRAAALALLLSNAFLAYSWWWNHRVEEIADAQLTANGVRGIEVTAYPTIFQTFLRRIVAVSDDRVRVGFHTPFNDVPIRWRGYRPAAHPLILQFDDSPEGQLLRWFAMDQVAHIVTATAGGDLLQAYDIRYGLPGDPRQGLWGIRVLYGGDGAVLEPARRFSIDRGDALNDNLARLWWGIIGDVRGGFLVGDD